MRSFKLKKIVAVALTVMAIATVSPIGASAAWKQDSHGWWNTEGNSYSKGWRNINKNWYYFGSNGYMQTGWTNDNGTWYYMQPSGEMQTGWIKHGGRLYFTNALGAMQTGLVEIDGKVYYFAPNGAMETGTVTINGVTYTFAASGEAIGDKIPTPTIKFKGDGTVVTPVPAPTPTPKPVPTPDSTESATHHHSHSTTIDEQYRASTRITKTVAQNVDGTTTIKPTLKFTPGTYSEYIYALGKKCSVTKDVYVTLNGKDAYISGNYSEGYTIEKGATGEVKIVAIISIYDSKNNKLYYVTPSATETYTIK